MTGSEKKNPGAAFPQPAVELEQSDDDFQAEEVTNAYWRGARSFKSIAAELYRQLPVGTYVLINVSTKEYVTGDTLETVTSLFNQRFPNSEGFVHRIGEQR